MRCVSIRSGAGPCLLALALLAGCTPLRARPAPYPEAPEGMESARDDGRARADSLPLALPLHAVWRHDAGRGVVSAVAMDETHIYVGRVDRHIEAVRRSDGHRSWVRRYRGGFGGGPVVAGGYVYSATDSPEGVVRCMTASGGDLYWAIRVGPVAATPRVADDLLIVGTLLGELIALDRVTGKERWRRNLSSPILAAPLVTGTHAVIATVGGVLASFTLEAGEESWRVKLAAGVEADLARAGDVVLAGLATNGVEARSLGDGAFRWRSAEPHACVAVAVGHGGGLFALGATGTLTRLHPEGGAPLWTRSLGVVNDGSLAVAPNVVLVGGRDGRLRFLDRADGASLGAWRAGETISAPPAVSEGCVIVAGTEGNVTLLASMPSPAVTGDRFGWESPREAADVIGGEEPRPGSQASGTGEPREAGPGAFADTTTAGSLLLYSGPFGASVYRRGELVGETPLALRPPPEPGESFLLEYPGYRPLALSADSLLRDDPPRRYLLDPIMLRTPSLEPSRSRWTRESALALLATGVAAGGAVLARRHADDAFTRYQRSANPEEYRDHFRSAQRWDRVSVAAWAVSHAALATAITFFIKRDMEESAPAPPERGWRGGR